MNYKHLLAMAGFVAIGGGNLYAQQVPTDGSSYYVYNTETGLFLGRGSSWGTKAIGVDYGMPWQVTVANGKVTLRMLDLVKAKSTKGFSGSFTDTDNPFAMTLTGDANGYKLDNGGNMTINNDADNSVTMSSGENSTWQFLNQSEYEAVIAAKTTAQNNRIISNTMINATAATIADALAADGVTNTPIEVPAINNTNWNPTKDGSRGGKQNQGTYGVESYQTGDAKYSHTLTGLQKGLYKVGIKALVRSVSNEVNSAVGDEGFTASEGYLDANGYKVNIKDWYSSRTDATIPNNTEAFVTIANNGGYYSEVYTYVGEDGKLAITAASPSYWGVCWFLVNSVTVTYYDGYDIAVSEELVNGLIESAPTEKMNADVKSAMDAAITTLQGSRSVANYEALQTAIANANASIAIYAQVAAINAKVAALDAAGQASYATTLAAYNNGTLAAGTEVADAQAAYIAAVKAQTSDNADFTALIVNPSFETGNMNGWTDNSASGMWTMMTRANAADPKVGNYWVEKYGKSGKIDVNQTINGLPAGVYTVGVKTLDQASILKLVAKCGETIKETIINKDAAADFTVDIAVDNNSDITIGLYCENHTANKWVGFDNFTLRHSNFGELNAVVGKMNAEVAAAQTTAIAAYNANKTVANYNAASSAITAAENSKAQYEAANAALTAQKALIDGTNVYDAEGLAAYNTAYETALAAYNNNTLAADVVNPTVATGWHGSTAYNFLLTPWTFGGEACSEFTKDLHINTWSTEGSTDGTDFTVPFFEYWVADAESLQNKELATSVTGLDNGLYSATAWVRVRAKNGVAATEATGVTLVAGNGEYAGSEGNGTVDATEGTQVGESQFTISEVTAYGLVKEGTLNIAFNIADANISWLSYKNVTYTKVRDLTPAEQIVYATAAEIEEFNAAIEAAEAKTVGFKAGEYAPYNNVAALAALKAAKVLDVENPIDIEVLAPAKEALDNAVWTVNAEEVNAVYDGGFSKTTIVRDATSFLPTGWTNTGTNTRVYKDATTNKGISATSEGACLFAKFTTTYGEVEGYEMPLKAGKYTLNFIYGGWNEVGTRDIKVYSAADNSVAATVNPNKVTARNKTAHTTASSWSSYDGLITIPSDGNYILSFYRQSTSSQNQICISDLAIFSISEAELAKRDLLLEIENYEVPTTNIGDAAFQYPTAGIEAVNATIEAAQAVYDNANATLDEVNEAIQNMKNLTNPALNAPAAGDKFHVAITFDAYRYSDHALEANATATSGVAVPLADNTANNNYPNDWTFTPVAGTKNGYTMSITTAEGTYYVCTGAQDNGSNDSQIRMTTDPEKALTIVVAPTKSQEGVYYLNNSRASNASIGCQDDNATKNGGWYTTGSHNTHTITLASKATANLVVTGAQYGTFIAPFAAAIPSGVTAYKVSELEGDVLTLVEDNDGFDANAPYIVYSESVVDENLEGWGLAKQDTYTEGLLTGVYTATPAILNTYVLQNGDEGVGFYKVETESITTVPANRAYLTTPASANVRAFRLDNNANAIEAISAIANNAIEAIYNANGVKVNALQKGINVVKMQNGKTQKVLVK